MTSPEIDTGVAATATPSANIEERKSPPPPPPDGELTAAESHVQEDNTNSNNLEQDMDISPKIKPHKSPEACTFHHFDDEAPGGGLYVIPQAGATPFSAQDYHGQPDPLVDMAYEMPVDLPYKLEDDETGANMALELGLNVMQDQQYLAPAANILGLIGGYSQQPLGDVANLYDLGNLEVEPEPTQISAYAKLEFPDGFFYMNTHSLILGRDEAGYKAAKRRDQAALKRAQGEQNEGIGGPKTPVRSTKGSHHSKSNISEPGGILREGNDTDDEERERQRRDRKASKKSSKKSGSTGSSSHHASRRNSVAVLDQPFPYEAQYPTASSRNNPAVDPASLRPSPNSCPVIGIHPEGTQEAWKFRGISRKHLKIAFNRRKDAFQAEFLGRNGGFVDEVFIPRNKRVTLKTDSRLQVAGVVIRFILPDNLKRKKENASDYDDNASTTFYSEGGKAMSFQFGDEQREGAGVDTSEDSPDEEEGEIGNLSSGEEGSYISGNSIGGIRSIEDEEEQEEQEEEEEEEDENVHFLERDQDDEEDLAVESETETGLPESSTKTPAARPDKRPEQDSKAPKKRGPGRPPKDGIMSKREQKEAKKAALLQQQEDEKAAKDAPVESPVAGSSAPEKNKVGRPRKHPKPDEPDQPREKRKYTKRKPKEPKEGEDKQSGSGEGSPAKEKKKKAPRPPRSPSPTFNEADLTPEQLAKPSQNYVLLIHDAIMSSERKMMSLPQIYRAIQRKYPWFVLKTSTNGWQSSVRHNLGQNDAFTKTIREGKGWMWGVVPGACIDKKKEKKASPPPGHNHQAIHPNLPPHMMQQHYYPPPYPPGYPHPPPNFQPGPGQQHMYMHPPPHMNGHPMQPHHHPHMMGHPPPYPPAMPPQLAAPNGPATYSSPYAPKPAPPTGPPENQEAAQTEQRPPLNPQPPSQSQPPQPGHQAQNFGMPQSGQGNQTPQPVNPAQPVQTSQTPQPSQPLQPPQPSLPSQSNQVAQSSQPPQPSQSVQSNQSAQSSQPPHQPNQVAQSSRPPQPPQPSQPLQPPQSTQATQSSQPHQPPQPPQTGHQSQPSQPPQSSQHSPPTQPSSAQGIEPTPQIAEAPKPPTADKHSHDVINKFKSGVRGKLLDMFGSASKADEILNAAAAIVLGQVDHPLKEDARVKQIVVHMKTTLASSQSSNIESIAGASASTQPLDLPVSQGSPQQPANQEETQSTASQEAVKTTERPSPLVTRPSITGQSQARTNGTPTTKPPITTPPVKSVDSASPASAAPRPSAPSSASPVPAPAPAQSFTNGASTPKFTASETKVQESVKHAGVKRDRPQEDDADEMRNVKRMDNSGPLPLKA